MRFFRKKIRAEDEYDSNRLVKFRDECNRTSTQITVTAMKSPYDVYTAPKSKRGPQSWAGTNVPNQAVYENLCDKSTLFLSRDEKIHSSTKREHLQSRRNEKQSSSDSSDSENELATIDYERMLYERTIQKLDRKYRKSVMVAEKYKMKLASMTDAYNFMKEENHSLQKLLEDALTENCVLRSQVLSINEYDSGAREAMCSVSELNTEHEISASVAQNNKEVLSLDVIHDDDEVKNFRSSCIDHQSFIHTNRELRKNNAEDDGYSTLNDNPSRQFVEQQQRLPKRWLSDPSVSSKANGMNSQMPKMKLNDERMQQKDGLSRSVLIQSFPSIRKANGSPVHQQVNKYSETPGKNAYKKGYSSCSSEDEALKMFEKQLRRKGDIVHYRPPRNNLISAGTKLYRHFGANERRALAHFEYLRDMSTDGSAMNSSRDQSPHFPISSAQD